MAVEFDKHGFRKAIIQKRTVDLEIGSKSLADEVNISHPTMWRIEKGCSPTLQHFADLCEWLGFHVPFHKTKSK